MRFRGENEDGLAVVLDSAPDLDGEAAGISPIESLLMSLGSCTGTDTIEILRKKRQNVTGYELNISGERAEEHPRVFTHINIEHVVMGKDIDPKAVARAIELSSEKYCSIIAMLKAVVKIDITYRIENDPTTSGRPNTEANLTQLTRS